MRLALFMVAAFGFVALPTASMAASCEDASDFIEALERADVVFVARITSVSDGGVSAVAAVEAIWKGPELDAEVELDGGDSADKVSGTTRTHVVGQRYLVVTSWSRRAFNDDQCTATRLYDRSARDIPAQMQGAVGADQARLPRAVVPAGDVGSNTISTRTVILACLVLLVVVIGVFLWRRAVSFRPELGESDFRPKIEQDKRQVPRPAKRRVAGWTSGRFSKTGRDQVRRLKQERNGRSSDDGSRE